MSQQNQKEPTDRTLLWGAGAAVLMVACCALSLLIAAGVLAGVGGLLSSPWLIGAGILVLLIAVLAFAGRHRSGKDSCCPPDRTNLTDGPSHTEH